MIRNLEARRVTFDDHAQPTVPYFSRKFQHTQEVLNGFGRVCIEYIYI
jgi:hypothetical protein